MNDLWLWTDLLWDNINNNIRVCTCAGMKLKVHTVHRRVQIFAHCTLRMDTCINVRKIPIWLFRKREKRRFFTIDIFIGSGFGFRNIQDQLARCHLFRVVILNSYTLGHGAHYSGFSPFPMPTQRVCARLAETVRLYMAEWKGVMPMGFGQWSPSLGKINKTTTKTEKREIGPIYGRQCVEWSKCVRTKSGPILLEHIFSSQNAVETENKVFDLVEVSLDTWDRAILNHRNFCGKDIDENGCRERTRWVGV